MIQLFTMPGSCSLAPHIVLKELGLPFEAVILKKGGVPELWERLKALNPTGQVPVIVTDEGYALTEGAAIMQYLVSKKPSANLFPLEGEARFRAFEWMNFIATSIHKVGYGPLFGPQNYSSQPEHHAAIKQAATKNLLDAYAIAEARFSNEDNVLGKQFTVVDAYLYVVTRWTAPMKVDISPYKKISAFMERMPSRPAVAAALQAEGLIS